MFFRNSSDYTILEAIGKRANLLEKESFRRFLNNGTKINKRDSTSYWLRWGTIPQVVVVPSEHLC
jgi:hypothetical protein